MKHYLIEQVELAIADKHAGYVYTIVKNINRYHINLTIPSPDEYRINRLNWFINKIKKSPTFKNVRGVPRV